MLPLYFAHYSPSDPKKKTKIRSEEMRNNWWSLLATEMPFVICPRNARRKKPIFVGFWMTSCGPGVPTIIIIVLLRNDARWRRTKAIHSTTKIVCKHSGNNAKWVYRWRQSTYLKIAITNSSINRIIVVAITHSKTMNQSIDRPTGVRTKSRRRPGSAPADKQNKMKRNPMLNGFDYV